MINYEDEIINVNLIPIINNLSNEEIRILDYLNEKGTDMFNGINIKDLMEDDRIIELGAKHSKLYSMLDRLKLINAIGAKTTGRYYSYYIKNNGKTILDYLENH